VRNLGHIENLSLYLDTKLIFLILEILAIETFYMPPAARGHDECFCTAGPSI
jgi:hypothetical protein